MSARRRRCGNEEDVARDLGAVGKDDRAKDAVFRSEVGDGVEDLEVGGQAAQCVLPLSREGGSGPRAYHLTLLERGAPDPQSHEGHEWLYVLGGRVRLVLGDEDLLLAPGEAAEFSTWTPHWITGGGGPAEVLLLMGHHGERAHLRGSPKSRQHVTPSHSRPARQPKPRKIT